MANLTLKNINKIYPNNVHAVFDFSLDIEDKEFIVFVGPSGCGKSTTLRMIAGLEEITNGEFYIDGKLMNYVLPKDRNVSMVFQNYALYPHMSVYRNMAYGLTIKKDYFPVYYKDSKISSLEALIKKKKSALNAVVHKMSKDADNVALKDEYDTIFDEISSSIHEIISLRKPVLGNDIKRVRLLNKEIASIRHEIEFVSGLLLKEEKENTGDEELMQMYRDDVRNFNRLLKEKEEALIDAESSDTPILKRRHLYSYEIDNEVYHAAEILDLKRYLNRLPNALSGGQRQRVALGRAIVRQPKVFLMDEPLSNLDAKLRVQTRGEILNLHKRIGATTIYVTHDQTEAMTLADRIVIMKDGYIQQIARPMDAFNDPENIFVAGFIGSPAMNFVAGSYKDGIFTSNDNVISLKVNEKDKEMLDKSGHCEVVLGIRPENISLSDDGAFKLDVSNIELLGNEFVLYTKTKEQNIAIKTNTPVAPGLRGLTGFDFDINKLYFFEKQSTKRIR